MKDRQAQGGTDRALLSREALGLMETFSQIGKCACAILDPNRHTPVQHTGWRPEWAEFTSVLPHVPERFFMALSKLNWSEVAKKPFMKFESAGHIVHAIAPVIIDGSLRCFVYAGYILSSRPNVADYTALGRERKFNTEKFVHVINDLPVLPESALTATLTRLVTQMKSLLTAAPATAKAPEPSAPLPTAELPTPERTKASDPLEDVFDVPQLQEDERPPWEIQQESHQERPSKPAQDSAAIPASSAAMTSPPDGTEVAAAMNDMHAQIIRSLTRDIRTALNGSIGVTGLLMRRKDPEVTELLDTVHRGNDTLLTMLDNLHDYYDVISGQMPLVIAPFDVRSATERAMETVRKRIEETGLQVNIRFTPDIPRIVSGDAARFQQILKNALLMVARYSIGGRLILAVRKSGESKLGVELQFLIQNVTDSAKKPAALASIDDDSTMKVYDSSDIGMVVSREIAGLLGGKMAVRTNEQPSAIFSIVMPEVRLEGFTFDTAASQSLQNINIAVIDNEPAQLAALSLQCGYWGPYVKTFTSAEAAYEWLNSNEPVDAVIISEDATMKDAFLSRLGSSRMHATLPIIVYSGNKPASTVKQKPDVREQFAVWETLRDVLERAVQQYKSPGPQPDSVSNLAELYPNAILVVEDDPMNRQLVDRILKKLGYTPALASNGIEAVKAASQKPYDIIFMDLQMPGMDGITASKTILSDPKHSTSPRIIALSANASQADREGAFKSGMVDFLPKPIILNKLQNAIIKWSNSTLLANTPTANAHGESSHLLDADVIMQTRELDKFADESVLDRLIYGFIKEVPAILDEMEKGFTSNNHYKVTKATSTLVGMSRNLGVKEFSTLARKIESEMSSAELPVISKMLNQLRSSYQNTCAELRLYLS